MLLFIAGRSESIGRAESVRVRYEGRSLCFRTVWTVSVFIDGVFILDFLDADELSGRAKAPNPAESQLTSDMTLVWSDGDEDVTVHS